MKLGYSMLLGEHIDASAVQHKDCEGFQIVCPSCREPVFKVERPGDGSTAHYLSHYVATTSYAADCELRVASMAVGAVNAADNAARGQRLAFFLQVLRKLIASNPIYAKGDGLPHRVIVRSKIIAELRNMEHLAVSRQRFLADAVSFHEAASAYLDDMRRTGGRIETAFATAVQERIAHDIWCHLLSPNARINFDYLFNHAYLMLLSRVAAAATSRRFGQQEQAFVMAVTGLVEASRRRGREMIAQMAATPLSPPFASEDATVLSKVMSEIMHEMIGTLIGLPYFDALREAGHRLTSPGAEPAPTA